MPDDPTVPLRPDQKPKQSDALLEPERSDAPLPTLRHPWQPPTVEALQGQLPQYEISTFIARGGMGAVYKGTQKALDRAVAIKVLPPGIEHDDLHYAERFQQEARAMAKLSHPGIVAVHDAGETAGGLLYFVMEFIEGTDVAQYIAAEGKVEPQRALSIAAAVCDALAFAHEEGIIHRDIKPSNIMLDKRGRVKVADFGLAKVITHDSGNFTRSDLALGTADFIAPEAMIPDVRVDARADVYAVGVMLYQMLTGKIPRGSFDPPSGLVPLIDPRLDTIVLKAMKTDREKRYASAAEMKAAIEDATKEQAPRLPEPTRPTSANSPRAKRLPYKALLIAAAIIIALFASTNYFSQKPQTIAADESGAKKGEFVPLSATVKARAIKLWDTAEKVHPTKGLDWKDGMLRLDGASIDSEPISRDAILRASLRTDAQGAVIALRRNPVNQCRLSIAFQERRLSLSTDVSGTLIGRWPLSRAYGPDEWLHLELRALGDDFSVFADGQLLGTAHNDALRTPGKAMLFAGKNGCFRDISYIPLDGLPEAKALKLAGVASAAVPASATTLPPGKWVTPFTSSTELPPLHREKWDRVTVADGWFTDSDRDGAILALSAVKMKNLAIRARLRWPESDPLLRKIALILRRDGDYRAGTVQTVEFKSSDSRSLVLCDTKSSGPAQVSQPTISPAYNVTAAQPGKDFTLEVAVIGTRVIGKLDGRIVCEGVTSITAPGVPCITTLLPFRNLEILNLDGLPEAEALKLEGITEASKSPAPQLSAPPTTGSPTFGGHRYQFVRSHASWSEAKTQAEALGGHLATITSKEEDGWARDTFTPLIQDRDIIWLGAFSPDANGGIKKWRWVTGESFDYTRWGSGEGADPGDNALGYRANRIWSDMVPSGTIDGKSLVAGFLVEWDNAGGASAKDYPQPR